MKISTEKKQMLFINLDDTHISITKAGSFNNKQQFLWTSISPTEGLDCEYESKLIGKTSLMGRIDLISNTIGDALSDIDTHSIDLFLAS